MANQTEQTNQTIPGDMRTMIRQGQTPSELFRELKYRLGTEMHIVTILNYFREAFGLTLEAVKPIAALTRNERRDIEDEPLFDELLGSAIHSSRLTWEAFDEPTVVGR